MRSSRTINKKGLTMIELVLATVLIIVGLIPLTSMLMNMRKGLQGRIDASNSLIYAQSMMDLIQSYSWDELSGTPPVYVATPSDIGSDTAEDFLADFDDIDDFHGYIDSPEPGFSRSVIVEYVVVDLNGTVSASVPKTDFKRISITVSWTGKVAQSRTIQTVRSNIF